MSSKPSKLGLGLEESKQAPLSAFRGTDKNSDFQQISSTETPNQILSDVPNQINFENASENTESELKLEIEGENADSSSKHERVIRPIEVNAKSNMLAAILSQMKTEAAIVPSINDVVLNADSSLNKESTALKPQESIEDISRKLNDAFDDLANIAQISEALVSQVQNEIPTSEREQVLIHFMLHDIVVAEYSGFTGDKLPMPTVDQISQKMGKNWDSTEFSGWDSDGIAHSSSDINAITKKMFDVRILFNETLYKIIKVPDGTKTLKAVEHNIELLDLVTPLLVNYSIYCSTKVITGPTTINLKPLTKAAEKSSVKKQVALATVVFAITPSSLGIDTSTMTKEELQKAMVIQTVKVPIGSSVQQPPDELLSSHGLQLPFNQYYKWSRDLEYIEGNVVIKVVPLSITSLSSKLNEMSSSEILDFGKETAKRAWNALKYPALLYMEHKLVKEFESGRRLQTRDFVFLRKGGSLMLYKYTGVKSVVEIPAVVDGMYVKHIHPNAFTNGPFKPWHLLNKHKLFSTDHFTSSTGSMTQLILPITIKYLPANFLYDIKGIEILVVPESVTEVSPNAFTGSNLIELYFNGACPKGFSRDCTDADVFVHRQNYKSFF